MSKQYCNIVSGDEVPTADSTEDARLAFRQRLQNAVSKIIMAVTDLFLGSTTVTEYPASLWNEQRDKWHVSAEATIDGILKIYPFLHEIWWVGDTVRR